jgi:hypothetical protein
MDPFLPFAGRAIRADDGQMEVGPSTERGPENFWPEEFRIVLTEPLQIR